MRTIKRKYIGVANTFHDSALAVVNEDGEIIFAEANERYLQHKRALNVSAELPSRVGAVIEEYCEPGDDVVFAFSWSSASAHVFRILAQESAARCPDDNSDMAARAHSLKRFLHLSQWMATEGAGSGVRFALSELRDRPYREPECRYFDHHLTHAAAACFTSPYDGAACAIFDGFGEGRAFASFDYCHGTLTELKVPKKHALGSLGVFYNRITKACGFRAFDGEEWKVMGLAGYAEPDAALSEVLLESLPVEGISLGAPDDGALARAHAAIAAWTREASETPIRAARLAATGQHVFTTVLLEFLRNLQSISGATNLALGGGCALNSAANGHILGATGFDSLHVFAAPADDGNALGAALLAHQQDHPRRRSNQQRQLPYLGSLIPPERINDVARFGPRGKTTNCGTRAPELAAEMLAAGKVVGWIQGRAEFGPRALGNRSILADPRCASMKDEINARVKFREEFRPFAPSILHEYGNEYFENYQESPYMERTLVFRPEVRSRVPAVVHVDGTGRLQTVKREWNERYFRLIDCFRQLTGTPLVLNTSFNVMGKPIAHSVEDVLAVFYTTGLDAVFIGDLLIEK